MRAGIRPFVAALALVALLVPAGQGRDRASAAPPPDTRRWIVQLRRPPAGGPSARALRSVQADQRLLSARLQREAPRSAVLRTYSTTLNGLAVRMTPHQARRVRTWPDVLAVTPDRPYHAATYATPGQIGMGTAWAGVGGQAHAGEGQKIAVIDSGIYSPRDADGRYAGNPCFDDAGYTPLRGYPRGDRRATNNKVLVARSYVRPGSPPSPGDETPVPGPRGTGHGTHVAGIAACNAGTRAETWAGETVISGVAPRARLLNYRVFYPTAQVEDDFSDGNGYTVELIAAVEDAVRDGADVIVGSWGSTYRSTLGWADPMVRAVEGAVDAGVVVVMAHGNSGPEADTGDSPAISPKVIAVGAVSRSHVLAPVGGSAPGIVPAPGDVVPAFSARGPSPDGTLKPDVVAPGLDVVSAGVGGGGHPGSLQGFGPLTGTSMAAPHVAGAAAIVRQRRPAWTPADVRSALMTTADEAVYLDDGRTQQAGVLDRGAGRVDVAAAVDAGLTVDPPSLGAGLLGSGAETTLRLQLRDAGGGAGTWDVAVMPESAGSEVSVEPAAVDVPPGGAAPLDVRVRIGPDASGGDLEAGVVLTSRAGGRRLHVPVWYSVAVAPSVDVLLLDADGSAPGEPLPDYAGRYAAVLDRLGRTHHTVDLAAAALPAVGELRTFRMALLFTGDSDEPLVPRDGHERLARWLDEGGRLWVAGQNSAEALDIHPAGYGVMGRSRLYHGFLGLAFASPSLWEGPPPRPTLAGTGPFEGITVDLRPGEGVAPQTSVEGARPAWNTDSYAASATTAPLLRPLPGPGATPVPEGTAAAFGRSSEPSPGEPRREFLYRTIWTGFGLEGVNPAGGSSPDEVARRAIDWLLGSPAAPTGPAGPAAAAARAS